MTRRQPPYLRAVIVVLALRLAAFAGEPTPPRAQWGEITYPLFGNLRTDAGTILVRFRVDEPLPGESGAWYQPLRSHWNLFIVARLDIAENSRLTLFRKSGRDGRGAMWTAMGLPSFPPDSHNLNGGGKEWKTGEVHHIGYTWDREGNHRWYVDGEHLGTQQAVGTIKGLGELDRERARLTLGSRATANSSAITVHSVHILDRALSREEMGKPPEELFRPLPRSLLFDRFDKEAFAPDRKTSTRSEVITGFKGETGGIPTRGCAFVDTPHGRGLRLFTPPAGEAHGRSQSVHP